MKKSFVLAVLMFTLACGKSAVEKPEDLIEKDRMTDIIYDLAILEAMRSQKPLILEQNGINPNTYVYKKYGIDSVQFANSNRYYASDIDQYKAMYDEVSKRLEAHKTGQPDNPDVGVVK